MNTPQRLRRLLALLLTVTSIWQTPLALAAGNDLPVLGDVDSDDLSPIAERKLGELIMKSYRSQGGVYDDREVTDYLNRFGSKIVSAAKVAGSDFEFFLVKDNSLNAFALPGGFIGVHSGLIVAAQSESELASVLSHEVGHVTQRHIARMFGKQRQSSTLSLAAIAVAILAARSNPQASAGVMAAGTGLAASQQLGFSRDAEREADRVGYQTLVDGGFDPTAMVVFFTRLQQSTRLYENNAPVYLRTHPLTVERIGDIQNRVGAARPLNRPQGLEYQLVRAKMKVIGNESIDGLKATIAQLSAANDPLQIQIPAAKAYGQAYAWMKLGEWDKAKFSLALAEKSLPQTQPMIERLGIEIRLAQALKGQVLGSNAAKPKQNLRSVPVNPAVFSAIADDALALRTKHNGQLTTTILALEALQRAGRFTEVESILRDELQLYRSDPELYERMAEAQNSLGKVAEHHVSLSYSYEIQGAYTAAIEQMNLAKRSAGNNFYLQSEIDSRNKQLQQRAAELKAEQRQ